MGAPGRLWRGELPLGEAFWMWGVAAGLFVNMATSVSFLALVAADQVAAALFVGYGLSVPYNVVAGVGIWRSAGRYQGDPRLAALARAATVIEMTVLCVT